MSRLVSILILGASTLPSVAIASCPTEAISMFAPPGPLPPAPHFVVHHQGDLMAEDVTTQVELTSGGDRRVGVRTVHSLLGRLIRQFVVVPETPLSDGTWVVVPRKGTAAFRAQNGHPLGELVVARDASTAAPRFVGMPSTAGFSETRFGCGSDAVVRVEEAWMDRSGLVEVTVRGDDFELVGLTTESSGVIELGVFMCGGEFDLPRGKTFAIILRPLGATGLPGDWRVLVASTPPLPPMPRLGEGFSRPSLGDLLGGKPLPQRRR
ncbi:MAG: hypothetical protein SFW67_19460 [Myxococcaceae bacterium]|nr:hypothetical protein [Myxococcaceae bacterium]